MYIYLKCKNILKIIPSIVNSNISVQREFKLSAIINVYVVTKKKIDFSKTKEFHKNLLE